MYVYIFETAGEAHFRQMEFETLKSIAQQEEELIVSLGGGAYCQDQIQEFINQDQRAFTVYLKYKPAILAERLEAEKSHRPIIKETENLLDFISQHLVAREPYYSAADLIVEDESDVKKINKQICSFLSYKNQKLSTI